MTKLKKRGATLLVALTFLGCTVLQGCAANSGSSDNNDTVAETDTISEESAAPAENNDSESSGDKIKIGVSENLRIEYIVNYEDALTKLVNQNGNMEIVGMYSGNGDSQRHFEHIAAFQQKGVDVIIIYTQDLSVAGECINAANGTPLIFINNKPDESLLKDQVVFVGCEETRAGRIQGEYVARQLKEQGKTECQYAMLMGMIGMETTNLRTDGAIEALTEAGITPVEVMKDTANWAQEIAVEKITPILGTGKELDAIFANNDEMALGAVEALKTANRFEGIYVCGIDGIEAALTSVKNGELSVTAMVTPDQIAKKCVEIIPDLVAGNLTQNIFEQEYIEVTADNVDQYLK